MTKIEQTLKIGFVGAGQMATALAKGFVDAGLIEAERIHAFDPSEAALESFARSIPGSQSASSSAELIGQSQIVFLAVKPQIMPLAIADLSAGVGGQLFVSIAAGVKLDSLCGQLGTERVIRVMPNTPALIGEGAAGFSLAPGATPDDAILVGTLLSAVGIAFRLDEKLLDPVTGLSGSGPAFVYMMIEALADGGVRDGLPREVALRLAAQTVKGAAAMVLETGEHPAVLKDRVASPAGTTIAGIEALEVGGLRGTVIEAVHAATERARELGG